MKRYLAISKVNSEGLKRDDFRLSDYFERILLAFTGSEDWVRAFSTSA